MKRTPKQTKNLLKLIDLMKYDPDPEEFSMGRYWGSCGTPACLAGHYAAAKHASDKRPHPWTVHHGIYGRNEFGITQKEQEYLFNDYNYSGPALDRSRDDGAIVASRVLDVLYGGDRA